MMQFNVGQTYSTRSICDHDTVFSFTVTSRTEKTVVVKYNRAEGLRRRIFIYEGVEQFKPFGDYSMAPIVAADDKDLRAKP